MENYFFYIELLLEFNWIAMICNLNMQKQKTKNHMIFKKINHRILGMKRTFRVSNSISSLQMGNKGPEFFLCIVLPLNYE